MERLCKRLRTKYLARAGRFLAEVITNNSVALAQVKGLLSYQTNLSRNWIYKLAFDSRQLYFFIASE